MSISSIKHRRIPKLLSVIRSYHNYCFICDVTGGPGGCADRGLGGRAEHSAGHPPRGPHGGQGAVRRRSPGGRDCAAKSHLADSPSFQEPLNILKFCLINSTKTDRNNMLKIAWKRMTMYCTRIVIFNVVFVVYVRESSARVPSMRKIVQNCLLKNTLITNTTKTTFNVIVYICPGV